MDEVESDEGYGMTATDIFKGVLAGLCLLAYFGCIYVAYFMVTT